MITSSLIGVIVSLAVLAVVYVLLKWIVGHLSLSAPLPTILDIVVGVIAIIIVLKFLLTLI